MKSVVVLQLQRNKDEVHLPFFINTDEIKIIAFSTLFCLKIVLLNIFSVRHRESRTTIIKPKISETPKKRFLLIIIFKIQIFVPNQTDKKNLQIFESS